LGVNLEQYIISIDLGTTLIKFIIYNSDLIRVSELTVRYNLEMQYNNVEFDADKYWDCIVGNLKILIDNSGINPWQIISIVLSGQAETIIFLDKNNKPLRKAISWLDERSSSEVDEIKNIFNIKDNFKITGQINIITTWPITKILWVKKNEPDIFKSINKILLLKDYIAFRFTNQFISEFTTYNYSYYFNIYKKKYWVEILDFVGVDIKKLPILVEPGESIGKINKSIKKYFGFSDNITLNIGANDQFAGMIGVGNIKEGIISEATGTVLTIATIINISKLNNFNLPVHYSAIKDKYVSLLVSESGGVCLQWLKDNFFTNINFKELDEMVQSIEKGTKGLIFHPYIVGSNSPEFNSNIKGGFFNIKNYHTNIDFARAVMEGLAFLIRKNLQYLEGNKVNCEYIISLGGGSKSNVWNQIKADITGKKIKLTSEKDPVGLGAAILSALELGYFDNIENAVRKTIKIIREYEPVKSNNYEENYRKFILYYDFFSKH
jgi:sugar (pentulose or hexulose) kinase